VCFFAARQAVVVSTFGAKLQVISDEVKGMTRRRNDEKACRFDGRAGVSLSLLGLHGAQQ
jgi:hypothetical protein